MTRSKSAHHVPPRPPVRILIAEDSPTDAELAAEALVKAGYRLTFDIADTPGEFRRRLREADYDIILADFNLQSWTAIDALEILSETGKDIPLIVVTGSLGDEAAVDCIKRGAADYVLKGRLDRLPAVFSRALREKAQREEAARLHQQIWRAKHDWELTFDAVPDPVVILDADCRIQRANRAAAEMAGLSFQQLIGRFCYEALHGAPQPRPECPHQKATLSGRAERGDMDEPHLGRTFDITTSPLRDQSGALHGCVQFLRDITERKRAEVGLQETNEAFRALIQASPLGIVVLDPAGNVRLWNPASERMFGWTEAEVLGRPLPTVPKGKAAEHRAILERVLRGECSSGVEVQRLRKDGSCIDIRVSTAAIHDSRGGVRGIVGFMEDSSERRRMDRERARLISAVEQAAEAVLITDPEGMILYVNPAFERITGYKREDALGQNPRFLKSGKQDASFYRAMWDTLVRGEHWSGHFSNKRKDGSIYEAETVITPVRHEAGAVLNYVACQRDVTRERELEAQLRQVHKMEAVERLAAGVAHDFNNLLIAITGYSDLLLSRTADERQRRNLEAIRKAGEKASVLTQQLLALGRQQELAPQALDLNSLASRMSTALQHAVGDAVELEVCPGPQLGRVTADPAQVEKIIVALALNARDAMPEGGRLVIETANVELGEDHPSALNGFTPGRYVMLALTDTAGGMDEEALSHVFEPFFSSKGLGKGSGLGLAAVHGIVKQSGGLIEVSSQKGQGTRFEIFLPRSDAPSPLKGLQKGGADLPRGTETILLVEDEEAFRALVREILRDCGYAVLEASGGFQALSMLERHVEPIDLLLTDLVMPRLSGRDLAERLRPSHPEARVIFMSGYDDHRIPLRGIRDLGLPCLHKPFTAQTLATRVREVLDSAAPAAAH
jgi:two-component system cell cycle sensor histidine kinase/response regulator CckA